MRVHRGGELPDELWIRTIGRPLRSAFTDFTDDAEEAARMLDTYVEFQRTVHDEMVCAFPEARSTIDALHARGVRVGVVTSKGREMTARTLARCGLDDALDVLITVQDVEHGKPDPEPVLKALERLGVPPAREDVLFVGDSPHDLVAGRRAGVSTCAVTLGPFSPAELKAEGPDFWVEDLASVLPLRPRLDGAGG
jgi:pyrophosphatase PpaX